jgi:ankyrin repeat protein
MGASFTNYHVREVDAGACAKALTTLISSRAFVTDSQNGWTTVYDERSDSQDIEVLRGLAKGLSSKLKTAVIATMVHDSDIFVYLIYENGELIDQFDSKPDYFGPVSEAQKREWQGNFAKSLPYAKKKVSIQDFKRIAEKEHVFEEHRAVEFSQLLGIDASRARIGFKYAQETEHKFTLVYAKGHTKNQALLVEAVSRGDAPKVRELLEKGTSPHQNDRFGEPLLVTTGRRGNSEIARHLIAHGADPFAQLPGGGDALWSAAAHGHEEIVAHLLEKTKGNPKRASSLRTALAAAVMAGHTPIVRDLIGAGADVNAPTPWGQSVLTLASIRGEEWMYEAATKKPFPPRRDGRIVDWKEMVALLLEAGAQVPFPSKDGPIDSKTLSAEQRNKVANALLDAGRKIKPPEKSVCEPERGPE